MVTINGRRYKSRRLMKKRMNRQLDQWVKGKSIHNDLSDECCIDFSCCIPELQWDRAKRKKVKRQRRSGM